MGSADDQVFFAKLPVTSAFFLPTIFFVHRSQRPRKGKRGKTACNGGIHLQCSSTEAAYSLCARRKVRRSSVSLFFTIASSPRMRPYVRGHLLDIYHVPLHAER